MYFRTGFSSSWSKFQYDSSGTGLGGGYFDSFSSYASTNGYVLNEWFLWKGTLTTEATTAKCYWGPVVSNGVNVLVGMQRMQVEKKGHITPFTKGTRSVSGSLIDLKRVKDINISNVSFDSNAQLSFDGTNDSVQIADSNDLDLTSNLSFEFIVKADSSQSNPYPRLLDKSVYLVHLSVSSPFSIAQNITTSDGLRQVSVGGAFASDKWTHIVTSYDGQNGRIYVNGSLVATNSWSTSLPCNTNSTALKIGGDGGTNRPLNGELPIAKIYNKVLTAEEVLNSFNSLRHRFEL